MLFKKILADFSIIHLVIFAPFPILFHASKCPCKRYTNFLLYSLQDCCIIQTIFLSQLNEHLCLSLLYQPLRLRLYYHSTHNLHQPFSTINIITTEIASNPTHHGNVKILSCSAGFCASTYTTQFAVAWKRQGIWKACVLSYR